MKKILSVLLCALLVMSSMATVAFADEAAEPATITFGSYLAELPAGTKIAVNTGDVAEGNTVVANINGVESTIVKANGYYAVTVPAGDNNISVAVKNGDTVVAQTATINVFGLSYLGAGENVLDGTFEIDSTNTIGNGFGYVDTNMKNTWFSYYSGTTKSIDITTESGSTYITVASWGMPESDPNSGEGYTKVKGPGLELVTIGGGYTGAYKVSVDYRLDRVEAIDPETGAITNTIIPDSTDNIKACGTIYNNKSTTRNATIIGSFARFPDTNDYDNDGDSTESLRLSYTYWQITTGTGKPTFISYNADGTSKSIPVDYVPGWNNYSVIFDVPNNMVHGFMNDIYVGSGYIAGVAYKAGHEKAGQSVLGQVTSIENISTGKWTVYETSAYARTYVSIDNFVGDYYAGGFASSEPQLEVTNNTLNTVHPAGSKLQISALAANVPAGGAVVAFVNGVKVPLTAVNGEYAYNAPLAAGYTSIYLAMLDANGNIVKDSENNQLKSAEWTYEAVGFDSEVNTEFDFNAATEFPSYETYSSASNEEKTAYNALFTGAGFNNGDPIFTAMDYAAKSNVPGATSKVTLEGTTDKYFKITTWGPKEHDPVYPTNPDAARSDASGTIFTAGWRGGSTNVATTPRYFDMSIDYRADKIETVNATTGVLESTKTIASSEDLKNWTGAEWSIIDTQYVWDSSARATKVLFGFEKSEGKPYALAHNADGSEKKVIVDVNPGEWHNYRAIIDLEEDMVYLLVDDVLVNSGYCGLNGTTTNVIETLWPHILSGRQYNGTSYNKRMVVDFDNWKTTSYNATDADTSAIVNVAITASGASLGIVPANLGLAEDEVIDIAVIAKTAAGAVEIKKYEDVTSESAYKAFAFDTAGIEKVFVWDWATLAPIAEVIE